MAKVMKMASAVKSRRCGHDYGQELWDMIREADNIDLMKGGFPTSIAKKKAKLERCEEEEFCKAAKAAFKKLQSEWLKYDYV